ncbi:MAG: hypothetical protein HYV99_04020 [Betaproteobacteria bacterium]|nr:hypothetical protein [Betaproteobacteria bacterium]
MPDVLIVIPGILGSVLRHREREVWGLSVAAGLHALASLGSSITDLTLTEDSGDPDAIVDEVEADRILPDLHLFPYLWKIDGYAALTATLAETFRIERGKNYFEFPYDWRRDNRAAARRLKKCSDRWLHDWRKASGNAAAKLIIVAHSMGGLVARYSLEVLDGWRDTKALVTFGTPYRGSVNALRTLVEGVRKGPFGVFDLSSLARSFTSVYQLLPTYPCVAGFSGEPMYLTDCPTLPYVSMAKLQDAAAFHTEIRQAVDAHLKDEQYVREGYRLIPVVGTHQETLQSAKLGEGGSVELLRHHAGRNLKGDGTVPRISATPVELSNKMLETYVATCHASLQNATEALHHVCEAITSLDLDLTAPVYRVSPSALIKVALDIEDAYWDDEPVSIRVLTEPSPSPALHAVVTENQNGTEIARVNYPAGREGWISAELAPLRPGVYRCAIEGFTGVSPVADVFTVFNHRQWA